MNIMENGVLEATKLISEGEKRLLFYRLQVFYQSVN